MVACIPNGWTVLSFVEIEQVKKVGQILPEMIL